TYSITNGSLAFSDTFSGSLSRVAGEHVGAYAISEGTLSLSSDYTLTFVSNDFTITARAIEVTADASQTKTYGDADPVFSYHISSGSLVLGDNFSGALSREAGEHIGGYAITAGTLSLSSDYSLTFVSKDFAITARAVEVTADASQSKTYGDADSVLSYSITSGNLAFSD